MQLLFVLAFYILAFANAGASPDKDGVLVLTDSNFDETIAEFDKILVEFYAPWCGHCKQLAPEYAKAAAQLADHPVKLGMVDATEEKEIAKKFGIQGFPTLKFFNAGKPSDYQGGRQASDIVSFMKKKSGPPAEDVTTKDRLAELAEANDAFVVGYFADKESAAAKAFLSVASGDDDNVYTISTAAEVKDHLALSEDSVVVIKSFDEKRNDLKANGASADDMEAFVTKSVVPLVNIYSKEKAKKIFGSPVKVHSLFFTDHANDHHASTVSTFESVAGDFKGEILFVNIPSSESGIMDYFGLKAEDLPAFVLADMSSGSSMKKFPFEGPLEAAGIKTFLKDFTEGNLKPTLKSEEPSAEDTAGSVVVLKGKSFQELVLDNKKDVLVEFYAPWCGHCKKLAPIFDELGDKFAANDNIVIAKMDATANEIDVEGVAVSGFPTLYFFKGNNKAAPMRYEGGRELDDLVTYIESNAHNDVAGSDEL